MIKINLKSVIFQVKSVNILRIMSINKDIKFSQLLFNNHKHL
jgi:hypothetical protein